MAVYKSKVATKDGRKWYFSVCYVTANGERKRKKSQLYASKQEAGEAERQFLLELNKNRIDLTFEEMYYQYLDYTEESIKGSTRYCKENRIKNHVLPHFGKMNIHDVTANTVITWKSAINKKTYGKKNKKYSLSYKKDLYKELRVALKYAADFCGLKDNVACKVMNFHDKSETVISDEEKVRYIKPDEYNLFISVVEKPVFKVFFAFLYYMGVRKGEAQALNWQDINFEENQVRIIKTVTNKTDEVDENGNKFKITNTKNRKNRTIKMPTVLKNMLLELYHYYQEYYGFNKNWFVFGGYRHLASQSIDNVKDDSFKLVNKIHGVKISRITSHEFRHSHASYLINQGIRPELIANRLGDTVEVILKIYAHLFPEAEDEIIETLNLIEDNYKLKPDLVNWNTKKEILESLPA